MQVRFGDAMRAVTVRQRVVSYNALTPRLLTDASGEPRTWSPPRIRLGPRQTARILAPYVTPRLAEQMRAVLPLMAYLALFQLLVLRQPVEDAATLLLGMAGVIFGLMLFMEGLRLGLMPFAEAIGDRLPKRLHLPWVLAITFVLGIGVTFAEPAIGALQTVGSIVDVARAPYLYALLNQQTTALVLVVGAGVGLAAVLGTLRLLNGWSLKPFIFASLLPTLALSFWCSLDPDLQPVLGLAWDCGGVTTGPVTVPLVLALGIGIANASCRGSSALSGFGIVTLASILPVLGVLVLGIILSLTTPVDAIQAAVAATARVQPDGFAFLSQSPWAEIRFALQAILPLIAFLVLLLRLVLREPLQDAREVITGLAFCQVGMIVFNLGLTYGLAKLGAQAGSLLPAAFVALPALPGTPIYHAEIGVVVALAFAFVLGFGATMAEPALSALGATVQTLTSGVLRKRALIFAVSVGVAVGVAAGVWKVLADLPLFWLLLPGYALALLLSVLSSEEFVNVAWDSAGVTTGPVTVPLVLAMGVGLGDAIDATEGFGILALASVGPIIAVLIVGLYMRWLAERRDARQRAALIEGGELLS